MPYRDDDQNTSAQMESLSSRRQSARDKKRQLEAKIRASMNNVRATKPVGYSSYQAGGQGTSSQEERPPSYSSHPQNHNPMMQPQQQPQQLNPPNHATNTHHYNTYNRNSSFVESLVSCVSGAIRLGAAEIMSQPSVAYNAVRNVMIPDDGTTGPHQNVGEGYGSSGTASMENEPHSFAVKKAGTSRPYTDRV